MNRFMRSWSLLLGLVLIASAGGHSTQAREADPDAFQILTDEPYANEDLKVTKVYRISHPAFRVGAEWQANRSPYNRDMTRVLINEPTNFTHPEYKETGRGFVWGYVDKLKTWETLAEYKALAKPILPQFNYGHTPGQSIYWSPFEGEENIVYAVHRPSTCVVRINVDTQQQTEVISCDPGDGTNVRRARALGLTADNLLIVNFNNEADEGGGFEIDLQKKTRIRYAKWPEKWTAGWRRLPNRGHGHGSRSPSGLQLVCHLGHMQKAGVVDTRTGKLTHDTGYNRRQKPFPYCSNFGSWLANENWYIVSASVGYGPKQLPVLASIT